MKNNNMLLPRINTEGIFLFHPPFNKPEYDNRSYKVVSIRTIKSINENDEDPFNNIYVANGLSSKEFVEDVENDIPIIELVYNEVETLYVPANRIKDMPPLFGYKYTPRMITFKLGHIHDDLNLSTLYNNIKEIIKSDLGRDVTIIESPYGETVLVSEEKHREELKFLYGNSGNIHKSFYSRYKELSERLERVLERHRILEKGIAQMIRDKEVESIVQK